MRKKGGKCPKIAKILGKTKKPTKKRLVFLIELGKIPLSF
jgi:hypothetical protein